MKLYNEDCIKQMQTMIDAGEQVDSIVTDPPYELGFMGKSWDSTGIAFQKETWELALQLLKPGGHLLAFGGSRTYHRMAVAIEDAGFEIRDQIMWLYGSGFPKSHNISKSIDKKAGIKRKVVGKKEGKLDFKSGNKEDKSFYDSIQQGGSNIDLEITEPATEEAKKWEGWGTALKPAHEPVVLARKPIEGTVAENVLKHGTGGINIDGSRVSLEGESPPSGSAKRVYKSNQYTEDKTYGDNKTTPESGRYPANVLHDGSDEVMEGFPTTSKSAGGGGMRGKGGQIYGEYKGKEYDKVIGFGDEGSAGRYFKEIKQGRFPANVIHDGSEEVMQGFPDTKTTYISEKHKNVRTTESAVGDLGHPGDQGFNDEGSAGRYFKEIKHEPVVMARKPLSEKSVAENVLKHGTGGINIDESRVETNEELGREQKDGPLPSKYGFNDNSMGNKFQEGSPLGRFPANVIHDGSEEVLQGFPETKSGRSNNNAEIGEPGNVTPLRRGTLISRDDDGSAGRFFKEIKQGRFPANVLHDGSEEVLQGFPHTKSGMMKQHIEGGQYNVYGKMYPRDVETIGDEGSAARFFYCAKVSRKERNRGLSDIEEKIHDTEDCTNLPSIRTNSINTSSGKQRKVNPTKNNHPTVKPIELMKYLCKLITPKGGTIFDPFMGSGSTGMAAKEEGFDFIGIEKEEDYYNIALQRINNQSPLKEFM